MVKFQEEYILPQELKGLVVATRQHEHDIEVRISNGGNLLDYVSIASYFQVSSHLTLEKGDSIFKKKNSMNVKVKKSYGVIKEYIYECP